MKILKAIANSLVVMSLLAAPAVMAMQHGKADGKKMMMNMEEFMKSCDMDHDGMMSKAEMVAHMEKMFDQMDKRKSGKLDKKQTEEFLKQLTTSGG